MGTHFATIGERTQAREHAGVGVEAGDAMRRRTDALFARPTAFESGGYGGYAERGAYVERGAWPEPDPPPRRTAAVGPPGKAAVGKGSGGSAGGRSPRDRLREALLERLPVWLRLRCGMEPRTVAAVAAVLILAMALALHHYLAARPRAIRVPPASHGVAMTTAAQALPSAPARPAVVVDVTGKVHSPGVLHLPAGSRVADALTAAGGPLPGTDTSTLNLARPLTDGEQVVVGGPPAPALAPGSLAAAAAPSSPVSLNTATPEQLDALPGVGPVLARHIIEFRTQHGSFTSVTQLRDVPGVGDRRYQDLRQLVRP
jgi:competence protein ComEA